MSDSLILVINCGSSSLKFALLPGACGQPLLSGLAECLGANEARLVVREGCAKQKISLSGAGHEAALTRVIDMLRSRGLLARVIAVGHRVLHAGERFTASALIDDDVEAAIEACIPLGPLHNPANLLGIRVAKRCLPALPQVAVFDTAFHQSMPREAYLYALPMQLYREHGVRRYGFHGTSHRYVAARAVETLGLPARHGIVIAHLGNGASATAVRDGKSVDTSMGMTPLEGLVMGTRAGDLDAGCLPYIADKLGLDLAGIDALLNRASGLLGLSELSNDCRTLEDAAAAGHEGAQIALAVFAHRLARHIGALAMSLERLDALVFTGGIGENSPLLRQMTVARLKVLGITLDAAANARCQRGVGGVVSAGRGPLVAVIATNEEALIAEDTARLVALARAA